MEARPSAKGIVMTEETLMEFPCDFPIKVMGEDSPAFRDAVRNLVQVHTGPLPDEAIAIALSRQERFVSITITVRAQSREQLDRIYQDLTDHDDVKMAL